ncbi:hypothetical protein AHAS_Ahas12G0245600 [Arachis hypogaea]
MRSTERGAEDMKSMVGSNKFGISNRLGEHEKVGKIYQVLRQRRGGEGTLKSNVEIPRQAKSVVTVGSAMSGVRSISSWRQAKHEFPIWRRMCSVFSSLATTQELLPVLRRVSRRLRDQS